MGALLDARALVELICQIKKDVESEMRETESQEANMETYWMVHRNGKQITPTRKVHFSFEDAYNEAERLARKEVDRFVILQAHTLIEPYEPLVITVESIGDPPAALDPFPQGPPPDTEPQAAPECTCGPSESESDRCCAHDACNCGAQETDFCICEPITECTCAPDPEGGCTCGVEELING